MISSVKRNNMIPEFIEFCQKLFPSIDPYTAEQAKKAMLQFEGEHGPALTRSFTDTDIWQGDVFSDMPFFFTDDDGQLRTMSCKAFLLSNTCDAVRDDNLLFAAMRPLSDFQENRSLIDGIKRNQRYSAFYLPDVILGDEFVDFEMISTFSRKKFTELLEARKIRRLASLSQVGYYMFICKLTVFFMRPEDVEVNKDRAM